MVCITQIAVGLAAETYLNLWFVRMWAEKLKHLEMSTKLKQIANCLTSLHKILWSWIPFGKKCVAVCLFVFMHIRNQCFKVYRGIDTFNGHSTKTGIFIFKGWIEIFFSKKARKFRKMAKFTVLNYNKFLLSHLGIFSKQLSNQIFQNVFFKRLSSYYILLTTTAFVVASVIFVLQNSSQFDTALRTSAIAIGTFQSIGMYFCFGKNIKKVNAMHFKLQEIIHGTVGGKHFVL